MCLSILTAPAPVSATPPADAPNAGGDPGETPAGSAVKYPLNTRDPQSGTLAPQSQETPSGAVSGAGPENVLAEQLAAAAQPEIGYMLSQVEIMLEQAGSIEELREMFFAAFPDVDASGFASAIAEAMIAADAGGRALAEAESG